MWLVASSLLVWSVFLCLEEESMLELSHKKLIAWQKAILLLPLIYDLCKKLTKEETYSLISQMKRAGLSVSNNIAEGAFEETIFVRLCFSRNCSFISSRN